MDSTRSDDYEAYHYGPSKHVLKSIKVKKLDKKSVALLKEQGMQGLEILWGKKEPTPVKPLKTEVVPEEVPTEPVKEEIKKVVAIKKIKVVKPTAKEIEFEKKASVLLKENGLQGLENIWKNQKKPEKKMVTTKVVGVGKYTKQVDPDNLLVVKHCHVCNYRLGQPWYKYCSNYYCQAEQRK